MIENQEIEFIIEEDNDIIDNKDFNDEEMGIIVLYFLTFFYCFSCFF